MNLRKKLALSREALLFDSHWFILKGFIGVLIAYLLFDKHSLIGLDMISVLFGLMLTLEPVNISGIKNGLNQIKATIIGGLVTAVIVAIGGVNFVTVPLAVAATLYITLWINWKELSVVAIFTSIYMTQYVQYTAGGDVSMFLTFRLRMLALGAGVLVAIVINFIFSLVFYRSMVRKRTVYILESMIDYMEMYALALSTHNQEKLASLKAEIPMLFTDIDLVLNHANNLLQESTSGIKIQAYHETLHEMRDLNHYFLDLVIDSVDLTIEQEVGDEILRQKGMLLNIKNRLENKKNIELFKKDHVETTKNTERIYNSIIHISSILAEK